MNRRRVLIVQPSLRPPGGGPAVAAWMIEALKDRYDIAVMSWQPVDVEAANRCYGTTLRPDEISVHTVPAALRRAVDAVPLRLSLLKSSLLLRWARRITDAYDILVSAENEADLGRRSIQYVHYPRQLQPRPQADIRWYHHPAALLDLYYAICDRLIGSSLERVADNVTLANSTWTAARVQRLHGNQVTVVHPPVGGDFPDVPWDERENGFLCIGRFAPEKELERVVEILSAVRRTVPDVHLHLVGARETRSYYRRVVRLARANRLWVHLEENLSRRELTTLIARHRYGIHGMAEEHFGIAPAEMVRAGCIVFVPDGGGQIDIVGPEPRLLWRSPEDAVAKIVRTLTDTGEQSTLRAYLASRRDLFSVEGFVEAIRQVVDDFERTDARCGGVA